MYETTSLYYDGNSTINEYFVKLMKNSNQFENVNFFQIGLDPPSITSPMMNVDLIFICKKSENHGKITAPLDTDKMLHYKFLE